MLDALRLVRKAMLGPWAPLLDLDTDELENSIADVEDELIECEVT